MGDTRFQILRPEITEDEAHRLAPLIRQWLRDEEITRARNTLTDWMYHDARGDGLGPRIMKTRQSKYNPEIPVCVIEGWCAYEGDASSDEPNIHAPLGITTACIEAAWEIEDSIEEAFGGPWTFFTYRL